MCRRTLHRLLGPLAPRPLRAGRRPLRSLRSLRSLERNRPCRPGHADRHRNFRQAGHIWGGDALLEPEVTLHAPGHGRGVGADQADDDAVCARPSRPARPVDVIGGVARWVVMNDQRHRVDMDATAATSVAMNAYTRRPERRPGPAPAGLG